MKRFRFPLRPVAALRVHRQLRAREAFAASLQAYLQSEKVLAATRERVAQLGAALFAGRRDRFNAAAEAYSLAAYRRECDAEMDAERATIAACAEMNERRVAYLEADRQLKVVERLEQKARFVHGREVARAEQAEYDDLSGIRAARRRLSPA